MNISRIIDRILGLFKWMKLFNKIFRGRGKGTYGKEIVEYLIEKYVYEYSMQKRDYDEAEKFITKIHQICIPEKVYKLKRIGRASDSGYFIPELMQFELVIAGGIGKNNDFEYYYASKGSKVVAIDPTIKRLPSEHPNITHVKKWIRGQDNILKRDMSIKYLIETNPAKRKLLKLDIEGSEYSALHGCLYELEHFDLIVVEFHNMFKLGDERFRKSFSEILDTIASHFVSICFKSNNWRNHVQFGINFVPEVFEVVFVNRGKLNFLRIGTPNDSSDMRNCLNNPNRLRIPDEPLVHGSIRDIC